MLEASLFLLFIARLADAGIDYMVTGSVASMAYGEPRLTHDVDLVVRLPSPEDADSLVEAFPAAEFYCPPIEVVRTESARSTRGHFNLIHHETGFKADIYPAGKDPLHEWAFERRMRIEIEGRAVELAPPEYVIIRKLEYYREGRSQKHVDDIRAMLRISQGSIDLDDVSRLARDRGIEEEWVAVLHRHEE